MSYKTNIVIIQIFSCLFFSILFLQSGLDKIVNLRDNYNYIHGYLLKTILNKFSLILFIIITLFELLAGALSLVGGFSIAFYGDKTLAFIGTCFATISLLSLFFGQRLAKDYAAAANMVPYIIFSLIALFCQSL